VEVARRRAHVDRELDDPAHADRERGRVLVLHARVEDDRAVRAALVGLEPVERVVPADLLLALDEHAHVDRELAGQGEAAGDVQQRQEVALVVRGAARVQAAVAHLRLEWMRVPLRDRLHALHVVVPVDQHGGCVVQERAQLADGQRIARGGDDRSAASRLLDAIADPACRALEVGRVAVS
jgi:hypothetical protein